MDTVNITRTSAAAVRTATSAAAVATVALLTLSACSGDDDSSDSGAPSADLSTVPAAPYAPDATDAPQDVTVSGNVESFVASATAEGWSCIPGADPYTGTPGATCSPGSGDVLTKAVFAVFDRADVADGAEAVSMAREATGSQLGESMGEDAADEALADQYLPLDSDSLAGYCVNTLGTCAGSGFDGLGLTLG